MQRYRYLSDDISLYELNDFSLGLAVCSSTSRVMFGSLISTHSNDRNTIDSGICMAISPRLYSIRLFFPLAAGIRETPHIFTKAASDLMRSRLPSIRPTFRRPS